MKFTQDDADGHFVFASYGSGQLKIANQSYTSNLLCFPDEVFDNWGTDIDRLTIDDFEIILQRRPDITILGTGARQVFPAVELRRSLARHGLQLDIMDSGAACRTYNLLVAEGRDVAAAVICF